MEKRLYDLDENGPFSKIMPPLTTIEEMLLRESLEKEGCNEPLDVWNGVIVDGHNRCRICKELGIPFAIHEMTFESEAEATVWLIKKQLGRRNISTFSKITSILRFEPMIREEAQKRMYAGKKTGADPTETFPGGGETRNILGAMIDVSGRTIDKVRFLIENANEKIVSRLESDDISIHTAYKMTKWHLETADDFTKYRIMKGAITLEQAYDEYKRQEKEELEQLRAQAEQNEEWDEGSEEDDPTPGGKIVPLFGWHKTSPPTGSTSNSLIAGGFEGVFSQPRKREKTQGKIVSIIPYLKAKGWNPEGHFDEDASETVDESNDGPKGEIISIIPFLKAKGRLPMDYEEQGDYEEHEGYEEEDEEGDNDDQDYEDLDFREDDADEPVVSERRVVNIDDIKICDPAMPLPTRGVSLISAVNEQGSNSENSADMGSNENDMLQRIHTEGECEQTANFDEILNAIKRVTRSFEGDVTVLLNSIRPEDRTEENGTQVTAILNDSITTIINKYTEVF